MNKQTIESVREELEKDIFAKRQCPYCKRTLTQFHDGNGALKLTCKYDDCKPKNRIGDNIYAIDFYGEGEDKAKLEGLNLGVSLARQEFSNFLEDFTKRIYNEELRSGERIKQLANQSPDRLPDTLEGSSVQLGDKDANNNACKWTKEQKEEMLKQMITCNTCKFRFPLRVSECPKCSFYYEFHRNIDFRKKSDRDFWIETGRFIPFWINKFEPKEVKE